MHPDAWRRISAQTATGTGKRAGFGEVWPWPHLRFPAWLICACAKSKTVNGCAIYCAAVRRWTSAARQKVVPLCGVSPILHRSAFWVSDCRAFPLRESRLSGGAEEISPPQRAKRRTHAAVSLGGTAPPTVEPKGAFPRGTPPPFKSQFPPFCSRAKNQGKTASLKGVVVRSARRSAAFDVGILSGRPAQTECPLRRAERAFSPHETKRFSRPTLSTHTMRRENGAKGCGENSPARGLLIPVPDMPEW